MVGTDEAFFHGGIEERGERVVEAVYIQESAGFLVDAELSPGEHLRELFQRAVAAGKGDESVGEVGHQGLSLVHRAY